MIKMPELVKALENYGFKDVRSYIRSGNLVFSYPEKEGNLIARTIEEVIIRDFGLTVPAQVMTIEKLSEAISSNPFLKRFGVEEEKLHVTFLADIPSAQAVEKLLSYCFPPDELLITGKTVYLYLPNGYGQTKFNNAFFENKLKVSATTRNWRTCRALLEMSS